MSIQSNGATPLMKQYFAIRQEHHDALLFFQVGDFYELFFDDAKKASAFLGIALTKRGTHNGEPIPLCGVPVHALDHYLAKLVRGGFRVVICDQLEEAVPGKVVSRGVTKVLTPGTLTDSQLLDDKSASYLFSFFPQEGSWGLLFGELLTAQLFATVLPENAEKLLESELARFIPDEIILPMHSFTKKFDGFFKKQGYVTTVFESDQSEHAIKEFNHWMQVQFSSDKAMNINKQQPLFNAMYTFYRYLHKNQPSSLEQFKQLYIYEPEDFLILDAPTQRNLELVKNNHDGTAKYTLFSVIDGAATPMGSRMIKKWLLRPLVKKAAIQQRLSAVDFFKNNMHTTEQIVQLFESVGDLERVIGRIALHRASVHDYRMLMMALLVVPHLREKLCAIQSSDLLQKVAHAMGDFTGLVSFLQTAINDDLRKDWIIKQGFDQQLDALRMIVEQADQNIIALEKKEQERTGIQSLKIGYTNVHGYYIEVTKANLTSVPDDYIRHQTLVGRERFVTKELQVMQINIMNARNQIVETEKAVFERVKLDVALYISSLRKTAQLLAHLDALVGFAKKAYENNYICPTIDDKNNDIIIKNGRHPVVEQSMNAQFIPNNTYLTNEESIWIITGPNMGGKSTYLRQVALISVMAHCGSFVPAEMAQIPTMDRIFTRIGSGDNLADGKSTFLIEMEETASICSYATQQSLVILDEVGRGTSTFDGLAIAQAVVEYLYKTVQARCLFATHYHELTHLKANNPGISSYYAASKKTDMGIVFLYRILKGIADGSFGIEVARLAALPIPIISRAEQILTILTTTEESHSAATLHTALKCSSSEFLPSQEDNFTQEIEHLKDQIEQLQDALKKSKRVLSQLQSIEYDDLSPKKAFDILWKLKEL